MEDSLRCVNERSLKETKGPFKCKWAMKTSVRLLHLGGTDQSLHCLQGLTFCQSWSESKLFANLFDISRGLSPRQQGKSFKGLLSLNGYPKWRWTVQHSLGSFSDGLASLFWKIGSICSVLLFVSLAFLRDKKKEYWGIYPKYVLLLLVPLSAGLKGSNGDFCHWQTV